jgi:DNA-binding CsgD family transcriptional regulator
METLNPSILSYFKDGESLLLRTSNTCQFALNYKTKFVFAPDDNNVLSRYFGKLNCAKGIPVAQVLPIMTYNVIVNKVLKFYLSKKNNKTKKYYFSFIVLGNTEDYLFREAWLFKLILVPDSSLALVYASQLNSGITWNNKVMFISEADSPHFTKSKYVISLLEGSKAVLKNQQYNILQLLSKGHTSLQIADILCISEHTVDDNRKALIEKFSTTNYYQMLYYAYNQGFI